MTAQLLVLCQFFFYGHDSVCSSLEPAKPVRVVSSSPMPVKILCEADREAARRSALEVVEPGRAVEVSVTKKTRVPWSGKSSSTAMVEEGNHGEPLSMEFVEACRPQPGSGA